VHARQVGDGWRIFRRDYLFDSEGEIATTLPKSLWVDPSLNNDLGKRAIRELLGDVEFDFPKSPDFIRQIVRLGAKDGDIVLDFFSGSGTSAEAILRQDLEDGTRRPFILVQLPEPIEDVEGGRTLASVQNERVRAAARAVGEAQAPLGSSPPDTGFRVYRLQQSNFTVWDPATTDKSAVEEQLTMSIDHVAEGASEPSMLTELLLKAGYPLTSPVESMSFGGALGYSVADGALLVCLSKNLSIAVFEAMVALDPAMIVVLDAGFNGNDELKVNALQTVRARNQQSGSDIALRVV
jgi:adenine-specific DNA-methyltransferase